MGFCPISDSPSRKAKYVLITLLLLCLASCRQYMADQPVYKPYRESGFFPDGSSARPLPEGTIPQGFVKEKASDTFPLPVTLELLKRGQERYNIFCTPCHDHLGTGQGMATRRGFYKAPPSFHVDRWRTAPDSRFFDVITKGSDLMPSYAHQIPAHDRWAIIAYIRALQLSFNAPLADVPPGELSKLESEKR
jgi:mono/diheme cytochrome c family protein